MCTHQLTINVKIIKRKMTLFMQLMKFGKEINYYSRLSKKSFLFPPSRCAKNISENHTNALLNELFECTLKISFQQFCPTGIMNHSQYLYRNNKKLPNHDITFRISSIEMQFSLVCYYFY